MKKFAIILSVAALVTACSQNNGTSLGPEETLEAFHKALCSGEFDQAESFCDTLGMREYINSFRTAWEKDGSDVARMVADILSETEMKITDTKKDRQGRTIFYELTFDGKNKTKTARMKNEEGEWKIERITDLD
jgi:hypothetical protein